MLLKNYRKHYKSVEEIDINGKIKEKFIYTGEWFAFDSEINFQKTRKISIIMGILISLIYFVMGFTGGESSTVWYVIFPYVFGFLPAAFSISAVFYLAKSSNRMNIQQRDQSFFRLRLTSFSISILVALSTIGQIVYIIKTFPSNILEWIFLCMGGILSIISCIFGYWLAKKCKLISSIK